jgi:hypothetical protein
VRLSVLACTTLHVYPRLPHISASSCIASLPARSSRTARPRPRRIALHTSISAISIIRAQHAGPVDGAVPGELVAVEPVIALLRTLAVGGQRRDEAGSCGCLVRSSVVEEGRAEWLQGAVLDDLFRLVSRTFVASPPLMYVPVDET